MTAQEKLDQFLACKHNNVQSFTDFCLDCKTNIHFGKYELEAAVRSEFRKVMPYKSWYPEFMSNPGW